MGPLAIDEGQKAARCTIHGGNYRVLFHRRLHAAPPALPPLVATSPAVSQTSAVNAEMAHPGGNVIAVAVPPPPRYQGMHCVQHTSVAATARCDSCGAYMCATCDFALPGAMHICPACATSSQTKLSERRKRALLWSFVMAAWATLGIVVFFVAAARGAAEENEAALGVIFSFGMLIPSIIGFAVGFGAIDKRLKNPAILWVPLVWNGILLCLVILLVVIGLFE
jgi:hypothetical protein